MAAAPTSCGRGSAATAARAWCTGSATATGTCRCGRRRASSTPTWASTPQGHRVIVYTRCAGLSRPQLRRLAVRRGGPPRVARCRGPRRTAARSSRPSVWIGAVAFGQQRAGAVQRALRRAAQDEAAGSTSACRPRPTCARTGSPTCTSRRATRPAPFLRVRGARGGKSRVVVTGFAAEGESYRVSNPILDSRYVYWLQQDQIRNEFFAGRGKRDPAARCSSSPTACSRGAVEFDRGRTRRDLLHERTGPLPGDRRRPSRPGLTAA